MPQLNDETAVLTEPRAPVLHLTRIDTPLGPMQAAATAEGVCLLEFADRPELADELHELRQHFSAEPTEGTNQHLDLLRVELAEYFAGTRRRFSVPLITPGTGFQQAVWRALGTIPYGTTRTYGQQAAALGQPDAVRAVAAANGQNRIAIVVPCHRVIGANGKLTGYAGGLWRKERLLRLEQPPLPLFGAVEQ